ncbi:MAG: nucleotidyltransferase substrate binding protein [Deltaproteobacteria bacterium]|nr:nucleotidyltransferase substrate binding protein [Deltaproteobacteria bacterium]
MASKSQSKFEESLRHLKDAIDFEETGQAKEDIKFLAISKAFEVAVEYAWKALKAKVEDEGVSAPSPKETIRQAGRLGFIENVEEWLAYINTRNSSTHDYFSVPSDEYAKLAKEFMKDAKKIIKQGIR